MMLAGIRPRVLTLWPLSIAHSLTVAVEGPVWSALVRLFVAACRVPFCRRLSGEPVGLGLRPAPTSGEPDRGPTRFASCRS
jgi:hypothetical protein